ncbi:MAG TPA: serine protease [Solirubrobacterales bacterium]
MGRQAKRLKRTAGLLAASFALLAAAASPSAGASGAHASIIGGSPASIEQFPYLAYIEAGNKRSGFACTGTVVAPRVVLTAAHCAEDVESGVFSQPAEYKVAIGVANPKQAGAENVYDVVATHVFPNFDPGVIHGDAAILILSRPTSAPPLALAGAADAPLYAGGTSVAVAGWGLTAAQNRQAPANLRSTTMVVQSDSTCKRRTRGFYKEYSPALQLCLLSPPANKSGTCFGDSGGPAIGQRADGTLVELAVISVVGPLCTPQSPNVLTRVDLVSTWVTEWIAATETGTPAPVVDPSAPLPSMKKSSGEEFAIFTLFRAFGERFSSATKISGTCKRASKTRFRCEIAWLSHGTVYAGIISPFYVHKQDTTSWESHYLVRWAPRRCLDKGLGGPGCKIHSKRG